MARPIEPTPVLKGKDASKLLNKIINPVYSQKKADFFRSCDATYLSLSAKK
jgi:hypothetical protein